MEVAKFESKFQTLFRSRFSRHLVTTEKQGIFMTIFMVVLCLTQKGMVIIVNPKLMDKNVDYLFQAILTLETPEECYKFFDDLCTISELKAMSQRLQVAKMLSQQKVYSDIVSQTGASTATISRVNRSLNYGADGYSVVFERLSE